MPCRGGGDIVILGRDIALTADRAIAIEATSATVRSRTFNIISDGVTVLGRLFTLLADTIRLSCKTQEIAADRISTKALDRVTLVGRADVLHAGTMTQIIQSVATTTAPIAVIATAEDLRLDGKRVTVG